MSESNRTKSNEPIAIVGMGCVLPGADNPTAFWQNCLEGKVIIEPISNSRWDKTLYSTKDPFDIDKTYSTLAGEVKQHVYNQLAQKHNVDVKRVTRLELLLMESYTQAIESCRLPKDTHKLGFILGMMSPDEDHYFAYGKLVDQKILGHLRAVLGDRGKEVIQYMESMVSEKEGENPFSFSPDRLVSSEILESLGSRFQIHGQKFIIDAACASSLASLDHCCHFLSTGEWDMAIAAGAETNLAPGSFSLFSRVGGLAKDKCLPFDERTEGLAQGEGAGILILKRLSDARNSGDNILAVVKNVAGSSDGRSTSLFQPNHRGQTLALKRVYKKDEDKKSVSYIEGHGTGTKVGDHTEMGAIADFFNDRSIPMGSVKGLIGHTKGAAGVANLIKAVFILNEASIPGLKYMKVPLSNRGKIYLSKEGQDLIKTEPINIGVSAFGFGGANYHTLLSSEKSFKDETSPLYSEDDIFLLGESQIEFSEFDSEWFTSPQSCYRLPPQSIAFIDKAQLLAVRAAEQAIKMAKLPMDGLPREDIVVVSGSILGLDIVREQTGRVRSTMLMEAVKKYIDSPLVPEILQKISQFREHLTPFSEDSAAGVLNNVIAGRVCNAFDFQGRSYNIESLNKSRDMAMYMALEEIHWQRAPLVFLITIDEQVDIENFLIHRYSVNCKILSTPSFAKKNFIQPLSLVSYTQAKSSEDPISEFRPAEMTPLQPALNTASVLFPGQGSLEPQRYANYIEYSEFFKRRFEQADQLALAKGLRPVSSLAKMYADQDKKNEYPLTHDVLLQNLFQFTAEVTLFDLLLDRGIEPAVLTGHSFGEFPALCCAGFLSFEDAFHLICLREEASPQPGELGTLVVASTSEQNLQDLGLNLEFEISNFNTPTQLVLSVESLNKTQLLAELRKNKIAAKELKSVGRPYHSRFMESSKNRFIEKLKATDWKTQVSQYPFVSSVDGRLFPKGTCLKKEELTERLGQQFVMPIDFNRQLKQCLKNPFSGYIELGLNPILTSFVTSCESKDLRPLMTAENILLGKKKEIPRKVFKLDSNKYVSMVMDIVSSVTGYKIQEITLEQQFEEDLRIDSIKKAEIFFRCLEETSGGGDPSIEISRFRQVGDVVEFFQKNENSLKSGKLQRKVAEFSFYRRFFCKAPLKPVKTKGVTHSALFYWSHLVDKNIDLSTTAHEQLRSIPTGHPLCTTLILDHTTGPLDSNSLAESLERLSALIKIIGGSTDSFTFVLHSKEECQLFKALRSFLKSYRLEVGNFFFKAIIDPSQYFFRVIDSECQDLISSDILFEDSYRKTVSWTPLKSPKPTQLDNKVLFAIGGAKGILKEYFSQSPCLKNTDLILCGRTPEKDPEIQAALTNLEGRVKSLRYFQTDISQSSSLKRTLESIKESFGNIDYILDASGAELSRVFDKKTRSEIEFEISSKKQTRTILRALVDELQIRPSKEIYFNSVAATYGNHGQSVYAFTNSLMSDNRGVHLFWPALDGVGMTKNPGILLKLKMMGIDLLPKERIGPLLDSVLAEEVPPNDELHILSMRDHFLMNTLSSEANEIDRTFGRPLSGEAALFSKVLDKEQQTYLGDHIVNNNCIAPGSMGLAQFTIAGIIFYQTIPAIKNFEMQNFILLD
ncbi:MAG: KR domain-containing protein, partial [Bdellovibrionales bacterium]|nr:KR domain-containing protein [Bdellovibrionales bacterium]